jgi:hypothetical protein
LRRREFMASLAPLPFLRGTLIEPKIMRAKFFLKNLEGDVILQRNLELREGAEGPANHEPVQFTSPVNQGVFASVRTDVGRGYQVGYSQVYDLAAGDSLVFAPGSIRVEF